MKIIKITTHLNAPPNRVWDEVNKSCLLLFVAHPVLWFKPVKPEKLPDQWQEGDYVVQMKLYGILPLGQQTVSISRRPGKGDVRMLRDNGHSAFIRRWDHLVSVEAEGDGTRYTDRIEIDAGIATPIVAAFARKFYAHRQRRWRRLVKSGFDYTQA